jgi:hypothetical protein
MRIDSSSAKTVVGVASFQRLQYAKKRTIESQCSELRILVQMAGFKNLNANFGLVAGAAEGRLISSSINFIVLAG